MAPRKPKRTPPTLEQCRQWARDDIMTWERRDNRFRAEQDLFFLRKPVSEQRGEEIVVPSDPAFITEKATRIIAALPRRVNALPQDPSDEERTQKIENLARGLVRQWEKQYGRGIHPALRYDEAKLLAQRGWICSRLMLNDDDTSDEPTKHTLWDAATVYPHEVGGDLVRVTHRYKARTSDLMDDAALPEAEDVFSIIPVNSRGKQVTVFSQYAKYKDVYYHMVWTGGVGSTSGSGNWLKKPTVIDYMPWVISYAVGTPFRATEWDDQNYIARIGESFFTNMVGMYKHQAKTMSILATILATMGNPPTALFLKEGGRVTANEISMRPGSRMVFPDGRLEQFRVGAGLQELMSYNNMLEARQSKAAFSDVSYGDSKGISSGYQGEVLQSGNRDVLFPYVACLDNHYTKLLDKAFELIQKFWPKPLGVMIPKAVDRPAKWGALSQLDIITERPLFEVHHSTVSAQEKMQRAAMATQLVNAHIISIETARGEDFLDLDDPFLEDEKVKADLVNLDPKMIQAMIPVALAFMGKNLEGKLYEGMYGGMIMQMLQGAAGQPGQPPDGDETGGLPQPASEQPGVNGMAAPPVVTDMNGLPPEIVRRMALQQQIRRMMQGAVGGAGGGGVPPQ